MVIIRSFTSRIGAAALAVLFVLMLMPGFVMAAPAESPINSHLSEMKIEDRNQTPQDTSTDVAIPPPPSQQPSGQDGAGNGGNGNDQQGNGNGQNGNSDSSGTGTLPANPNAGNTGGNGQSGGNGSTGVTTPGTGVVTPPAGNGNNGSGTNPNGVQTPDNDSNSVTTPNNDQSSNNQDGADQNGANQDGANQDNRSWWDRITDGFNQAVSNINADPWGSVGNFFKGAGAGLLGAVVVVGAVALVAAFVLSAPISVPVLITALVVGAVAGGIYALVAGNNFEFWDAFKIGGFAAAATLAIGTSGVGAAFRGAWKLVTQQGIKGALRTAGTRALTYFRGLGSSFMQGLRSPVKSLLTTIKGRAFRWTFGLNLSFNTATFFMANPRLPTLSESGVIIGQSLASSLLFSKVGDLLKVGVKSTLGKNVSAFTSGLVESVITTFAKHQIDPKANKDKSLGEQVQGTFISSLMFTPAFSSALKKFRIKFNIGTSHFDLEKSKVDVVTRPFSSSQRSVTNQGLITLWNNEQKIKNQQGLMRITPSQEALLRQNDLPVQTLTQTLDAVKKIANFATNNEVNQILDRASQTPQNGGDIQNKGESKPSAK